MNRTKNGNILIPMTLLVVLFFASTGLAADKVWLMGTSSTGTAGYASTMGLTSLVNKYTKYKLEAMPTPGSTASVRLFGKKTVRHGLPKRMGPV